MTDSAPLEDLPYEELKHRAFKLAERRHDLGFFIGLFEHTPAINATADEGGSLGEFTGSLIEAIEAARQVFGEGSVGEAEPLFRARFASYLREHGQG